MKYLRVLCTLLFCLCSSVVKKGSVSPVQSQSRSLKSLIKSLLVMSHIHLVMVPSLELNGFRSQNFDSQFDDFFVSDEDAISVSPVPDVNEEELRLMFPSLTTTADECGTTDLTNTIQGKYLGICTTPMIAIPKQSG